MSFSEKNPKLIDPKGDVHVDIAIGDAQFGSYRFLLYDEDGGLENRRVARGDNEDDTPDNFDVKGPLAGKTLGWIVAVSTFGDGEGQPYSIRIELSQSGTVLDDGEVLIDRSTPDGGVVWKGAFRFIA